jgi:hypothetical protein
VDVAPLFLTVLDPTIHPSEKPLLGGAGIRR